MRALSRAIDRIDFIDKEHTKRLASMLLVLHNKVLNQTQRRDSLGRWV